MPESMTIKTTTVLVQARDIIAADIDQEKAMLSITKGKYYGLDAVGGVIWESISRPQSVQEIIAALMEKYQVEESTCRKDVCLFLSQMHAEGLVTIV